MSRVFLFPGQGAQYPGMTKDLYEHSETVRELFKTANKVLGRDMADLLFNGSKEDLKSTNNTQVAVTLANVSAAAVLREFGQLPSVMLGFSVGEYAALHEAAVLDSETLFRVVAIRGEVMERYSRKADTPSGAAAMTAVLGLPFKLAASIVTSLDSDEVFIANHSSPTQIVLAGTATGLEMAETALTEAGALRVVRLKVSGPFHSPLLDDARTDFEKEIANLSFNDPKLPVISNVTALPIESGVEARRLAGEQIVSMVCWVDSQQYLLDKAFITNAGDDLVLEVGPGKVLSDLWKSFYKDLRAKPAGTLSAIQAVVESS